MTLFITVMSETLDITFTEENISAAAKLTFGNVILISLLFTAIDAVRRKLMVDRPTKRIISAGERITGGDFSVRIESFGDNMAYENFNSIAECFNKMAEELGSVETLRTDFIANVSHELKTPLAVMQNYGTMLGSPDLPDEKRIEYAKGITDNSRRLASLITNILKLNKLENQQIFPVSERFDLSEQLCQSLLQFEEIWEQKGIEIETDIEDSVYINSDSELLGLVWNNLFSNAFKFTESGGTVSVQLTADNDFATVKISDTGCGISAETGAHIFEKFYQGDTSHTMQGNGLGLALVKRVVDIMNGEIAVESKVGMGSTFTVKLRRGDINGMEKTD
ncbi:MAG: HAMP domain-containing histidine kinase [Oscillospiraceae bacterium]|nr:HAMP domain-containing histidine kinase [Oscillospiraceae bacterium]MBQ8904722.1 HAMP domain-containing histidine kinase [Oscillospiraceae bacterium]